MEKKIGYTVWENITWDYHRNLFETMPKKMPVMVEGKSGHTKY